MNNNSDQCGSEDHMSRVILSKLILNIDSIPLCHMQ